jgi:RNA polymerase sigma factor (sigma-70 family)
MTGGSRDEFRSTADRYRSDPEGPAGPSLFALACALAERRFGGEQLPLGAEPADLVELEWEEFVTRLLRGELLDPAAYFLCQLRSRVLQLRRKGASRAEVRAPDAALAVASPSAGLDERIDRLDVLTRVLGALGERDRMVFVLRAAYDEPPSEVARAAGISVDNVHTIVSRVRRSLREELTR